MKTEYKRNGIGAGAIVAAVVVVILIAAAGYFIFAPGSSTTTSSTSLTTTTSTTPTTTTSTTTTSTTSSTTTSSTQSGGQTVTIDLPSGVGSNQQLNFSPATVTVAVGTTIDFVSQDTSTHNIDFTSVPSGSTVATGTTSPNLKNGDTYNVTLTTPGTYTYVCDYHNWMKGTIVVGSSGTTTTTSSSSSSTQTTSTTASTTTTSSPSGSSTTVVTMPAGVGANMSANFAPATITVVVGVNNTIVWTNDDTAVHNVDFQSGPSGFTLTTSVNVRNGQSTPPITLTIPGTYTYVCDYHTWMKATIIVVAAH